MTDKIRFQGDLCIIETDRIPDGATEARPDDGKWVLAHSETGHHHVLDATAAKCMESPSDPNVCYLQMLSDAEVTHLRDWDTHGPVALRKGATYKISRGLERGPEGWRRAAD